MAPQLHEFAEAMYFNEAARRHLERLATLSVSPGHEMYRDVSFAKAVVLIIAGFDRLARSCNVRLVRSNPALTLVSTLAADSQVPAAAAIAAATMAAQPAAAAAAAAANAAAAAAVKTATERLVEDNAVDDSWAQIKGWLCDNTSVVSKEAVVRRSGRVYARLRGDDGEASKQMRLAIVPFSAASALRSRRWASGTHSGFSRCSILS